MFRLNGFLLISILALSISNLVFGQLSEVDTDSGTYRGHISSFDEGVTVFQGMAMQLLPLVI